MTFDEDTDVFVFVAAVAAARVGESDGFDQLYERFAREVYLLGVFECHSEPESLVDVVMSDAFGQITNFVGSEPAFAGLLFQLAMEQIVKERVSSGLEADEHVRCGQKNFDEHVASDQVLQLHDSLHWLSFSERKMLHLRLTFGLNLLQAARIAELNIPEARAVQSSIESTLADTKAEGDVDLLADLAKVSISS